MWVISHNYSINLDNCLYYHSVILNGTNGTEFKLSNGSTITITCAYKAVRSQINARTNHSNDYQHDEVVLVY